MDAPHKTFDSRQQLESHLAEQFETKAHDFEFDDCNFRFWSLAEPDSMLDKLTIETSHKDLAWQPYWAQLWDASIGMCHELASMDLRGKQVLDLGCGLGVTGAVAASRGATVLLADNAPPALEFALLNCWPWREQITCRLVDWTTDDLKQQFDLILGSDIVYDPNDLVSLDKFWRVHLPAHGQILLSEPNRAMTGNLMSSLSQLGWKWTEKSRKIPNIKSEIRFFELYSS